MRRGAAALTAVLALCGAGSARAADPPRLTVQRGADAAIVDDAGREVLLRGVNVNQLGDYFQADPTQPTTTPLTEDDFAQIAREGFNTVRLTFSWSSWQPTRGAFDESFLARVRQAVGWAKAHGLYVVLDMHQDAWGKEVATPKGAVCPPGLAPAVGWDGAPKWATYFDGQSTCRAGDTRELSPAVAQAFENFYADREGIQSELVATWGRIARAFAADPAVAGYDLFNEPHPGLRPGVNQGAPLGRFYARAIAAIRDGERAAPGGFAHLAFFEPSVLWDAFGTDTIPPADFTDDPRIVFAPHLYAESLTLDRKTPGSAVSIEDGFRLGERAAASYGAPLWSGEWGFFGSADQEANAPRTRRYGTAEDAAGIGGAFWVWKQACGDPHMVGVPGASDSLNRFDCPGDRPTGQFAPYSQVLSRAAPRAVPGRLTSLTSDPQTGRFALGGRRGDGGGSCRLEVWVPGDVEPALSATGVDDLAVTRRDGGWLATGCAARGDYAVRGARGTGSAAKPGSRARCRSRRAFAINLRVPKRVRLRTVTVRVGAAKARRLRGNRHSVRISLAGRPASRVVVRVSAVARDGRRFAERRVYRTCA